MKWIELIVVRATDNQHKLAAALEGFGRIHHTIWVADEKT